MRGTAWAALIWCGIAQALVAVATAAGASGLEVRVCVDPRAGVDPMTERALVAELARIAGPEFRAYPCAEGSSSSVAPKLTVMAAHRSGDPVDALAAARVASDGRGIAPELTVFVNPVARLIGTRLPGVLGRALARVSAHELGHYLGQRTRHDAAGLMAERFSGPQLLAASPAEFRMRR